MRKLYSIVLTACAMLVSASLFAVDVTTLAELQGAIDNTPAGGTVNIRLTDNIDIANTAMPIRIYSRYADAGKIVNLDLNGHNITSHKSRVIELFKGTLNITGKGTIEKNDVAESSQTVYAKAPVSIYEAIFVTGSFSAEDANYSNLTIGKNVRVQSTKSDKGIAISVNEFQPFTMGSVATGKTWTMPTTNLTEVETTISGAKITKMYDNVTFTYNSYYKNQNGEMTADYTTVVSNYVSGKAKTTNFAYGVNVEVNGYVYGAKYGIKINGSINAYEEDPVTHIAVDHPYPYVHVTSTAEVSAFPTSKKAIGVYSSGYGKVDIEGEVHAATGVAIKGGQVTLTDANIYSEYTDTWDEPTGARSGVSQGGSAVTVESASSYPGHHTVVIAGDTKLTGTTGYALEEVITDNKGNDTKVSGVSIEGGTFAAGDKGGITISNQTKEKEVIEVTGGVLPETITVKAMDGDVTMPINQFIPDNGTGYQTITVQGEHGPITTVVKTDVTIDDAATIAGATGSVNWTGMAETLDADKNLDMLMMNAGSAAAKQVLTVGDKDHEVTLTIGQVTMSAYAQIVVSAGSSLVITGTQGIIAPVTDNIVLKANSAKYAQFLFNPAVSSNRHPNATVEWISDSYRVSSTDRLNQPFGIPTANKIANIYTDRTDHRVAFFEYDYDVTDDWVNIGYLNPEDASQTALDKTKLNKPFNFYQILCTSATAGTKVTMEGELVGNVNNTVDYLAHFYMGFANSYTADIDLATILPTVPGANEAVYIYRNDGYGWFWDPSSIEVMNVSKIAPMQAFVILNRGTEASSEINYKKFVWDPVMNPKSSAPARSSYDNKLQVRVVGQNATDRVTMIEASRFSAGFDKGEAEKYMNSGLNIYVTDETPMGIFASDDINNTYLGFNCKKSGVYTISFEQFAGEGLALVDLKNNTVVNIDNNATYNFTAEENEQNDYRFQIVKRQNVVTDVENVENGMKNGGIYTLTGMYLGNMSVWNTLPAGIYVVNGEKMVK